MHLHRITTVARRARMALLLAPALCLAQSTGLLTGTVVDPSGAVVPAAAVLCRNVETDLKASVNSNSAGLFRFPDLPVGSYEITVTREGFATLVRSGVHLLTGQTVDLTLTLRLGQTGQEVEVREATPLVQTATSELQTTVDSRQMADLPLNGRNAFELAVLTPGAVETEADMVLGQQDNVALAVNGLRPTQNNWQLDGASYTNLQFGSAPNLPNPDTLQEFTARTSLFSADSKGGGASVKMTTRSGTNQLHGTIFEFLRNDAMDARNFFSLQPHAEAYKQNQYGGTIGGPIRRDKLFYFGSFQGTNKRGNPSPRALTVPSVPQRSGDYSQGGNIIVDQAAGAPFPGNKIPQSRLDSIALGLLPYIPLPNYGSNTAFIPPPATKDDYQWLTKIDYMLSDRDHISGRYFWDRYSMYGDSNSAPAFHSISTFRNQTAMVSDTHTFSPTLVMRATFNFLQTFRTDQPVTPVTMQALGAKVPLAQADVPEKIYNGITGYFTMSSGRGIIFNPGVYEATTDFSHASGRHLIRFGGDFRRSAQYALNRGDDRGNWTFNAQRTNSSSIRGSGDGMASMLLGLPSTFTETSTTPEHFLISIADAWVQDDVRVNRRLTLNLGLRWDPWLPASDTLGPLVSFVPGYKSTIAPLAPMGLGFSGDPGIPNAVLPNHWTTFAPRFGLAWDIFGDGKTVARGGYGIYRMTSEFFGLDRQYANSAPTRSASVTITNPPSTADPYAGYTGTLPFPFVQPTPSQLATYKFPASMSLNAFDPSARAGYTQSWNVTLERQVIKDGALTVSYVGNHYIGSLTRYNTNPAVYGPGATTGNTNSRRIFPGYANIFIGTSYGYGYFDSLQVQFVKRTAHGLTLMSNYAWSKAIGIDSAGGFGAANGEAPRDPFNRNLDKGPVDFDVRHSAKIAAIYDVPGFHHANPIVRAIANNWQLNGILQVRSGFPYSCRSGVDNSFSGVGNDTCDQVLLDTAPLPGSNPLLWVNTKAFTTNAIGTFGNMGRNSLRRPGVFNVDFSLFRVFRVTESLRAELRGEAFNALNHTNFDLFYSPSTYASSQDLGPNFGILSHARDPRLMQVALKLRF